MKWQKTLESLVSKRYQGVEVKLKGEKLTLVLPDIFEGHEKQISAYAEKCALQLGALIEFYPEKAVKVK